MQPPQTEHVIGAVSWKKEGMLQTLGRRGVECAIHHERDVSEE